VFVNPLLKRGPSGLERGPSSASRGDLLLQQDRGPSSLSQRAPSGSIRANAILWLLPMLLIFNRPD
jgi:hypothetical protein